MAKGGSTDYENNMEEEENWAEDNCELGGEEYGDGGFGDGDTEGGYEEAGDEDDENFRLASKRGKGGFSPKGRGRFQGAPGSRNGPRRQSRFRGHGAGFGASNNSFQGTATGQGGSQSGTQGSFGGSRGFRGNSWDNEWSSNANNDAAQRTAGIPPLMATAPLGAPPLLPHLTMNNSFQNNSPYGNSAQQMPPGMNPNSNLDDENGEQNNGMAGYQRLAGTDETSPPGSMDSQRYALTGPPGTTNPALATMTGPPGTQPAEANEPLNLDDANTEIWVETKAAEGKSYYYNAKTRDTTWTKPEGPNIKIISQEQVEAMAAAAGVSTAQQGAEGVQDENQDPASAAAAAAMGVPGAMGMPHMMGPGVPPNTMQPPPGMMPPFGAPPFGGPPPFGMPPPGFPPTGFPGGFQPPGPWGFPQPGMPMQNPMMAPNMMGHQQMPPGAMPGMPMGMMPGMEMDDKLDPDLLARAAEWSEHRAPDNRIYYYNNKLGESVWEKPDVWKELEAARYAAAQNAMAADKPSMDGNLFGNMGMMDMKQFDKKRIEEDYMSDRNLSKHHEEEEKRGEKRKEEALRESEDAEKKKKEEDEKSNVQKVQDKSKPVSSTPVPGTPWCVVWTGDGRVFFYNPSARTSVWERPEELAGRSDVTKMVGTPPAVVMALRKESHDNSDDGLSNKKIKLDTSHEQDRALDNKEEHRISNSAPAVSVYNSGSDKQQINVGKEAAMEAEVRAARERAVVPLETRINSFREMLSEKEVSAFSTWEKELHKIVFDPRYLLLTSKERKQVFEKYVKERAEEERQEKRNRMKQRKEDYRKLMEEANLHGKSSFNDFASKYGKDDRFRNIEKMRERESLFNEFILEVRKREKEEKSHRKDQIRRDFMDLLREHSEIDRHSRWSEVKKKLDSDSRYKMVDSSSLREDYFRDYIRILKDERRHREKDRDRREKNEKEKDQESDPELANASDVEKDREAEKAARVEASLREREKEVQRTLAVHLRDRDNEREQHKHDEAVHHFNALLADLVRNSELNWREAKRQLRKDHRWDLVDLLERDEKEKFFNEHIDQLTKKKREKFRELLDETSEITLNSSWKDVRRSIKEDPRYTKFSSSERKCEKEFKEYMKDKLVAIKSDFRELLQETKLITHKTYVAVKENDNHLKEIEDILKNDRRYLMLDHIPDERKELLITYLDDLEKRGPPPPPTASEPSRRIIK